MLAQLARKQVNLKSLKADPPAASSGAPFPRTPQIIFANWREALHQSGLSSGIQTVYSMAAQGYLDYCAHNAISVDHRQRASLHGRCNAARGGAAS